MCIRDSAYTNYCFSSADEQVVVGCQCFRDRTPEAPCGTCDERDGTPRLVGQVWAQRIRRHGGSVGVAVGSVLWLLLARSWACRGSWVRQEDA